MLDKPDKLDRTRLPSILAIDAELERRREERYRLETEASFNERRQQQQLPHGEGLLNFIRYYWSVIEPARQLVEGWPIEAMCEHLDAVTRGVITKLLINVPPGFMKSLLVDVFWPAWEWGPLGMPHLKYVAFSYSPDLTERDNEKFAILVQSARYRELWGERFALNATGKRRVTNSRMGFKFATSIRGVGTGERGDRVVLDDPHNVKEIESDVTRQETVRWFRESMSNRLNDMTQSAIVIIMQRLHEEDVSGEILAREFAYCHLMVPMEFDPTRYPADYEGNEIGWIDPRALDDEGNLLPFAELDARDGELAWPERFPASVVEQMKYELGPIGYAGQYCTPAESPVLMADLSMKPIGQIQEGDRIVGFTVGTRAERARYKEAQVLSISSFKSPVVKITFESGYTARCTEDHQWFTGRSPLDGYHRPYARARAPGTPKRHGIQSTSVLCRVCPPGLPEIKDPADIRLAGWLSGFFDGEGSASLDRRGSVLLSFSQGTGRNLILCDKLESTLARFGFPFSYREHVRDDRRSLSASAPVSLQRFYWLKNPTAAKGRQSARLALYQRFLHIAQPTKWKDRIVGAMLNGRMFTDEDRVVSIEPDGEETVYGLETTTGNYVVWGLASSNSQRPMPRKGGIFDIDWWQHWEPPENGKFPHMDFILASVDTAFTEKEENDPSGLTVWGIYVDEQSEKAALKRSLALKQTMSPAEAETSVQPDMFVGRVPRVMLMHAWRKHLRLHGAHDYRRSNESYERWAARTQKDWGLVEWVAHTCRRFNVDILLVEAKANGLDVIHEMQRLYAGESWTTQAQEAPRDKVARAISVQPAFSQEIVYCPARDWAEMVKTEMALFPRGKYKDLTDSATHALAWLRRNGLIQRPEEMARIVRARAELKKPPTVLYHV